MQLIIYRTLLQKCGFGTYRDVSYYRTVYSESIGTKRNMTECKKIYSFTFTSQCCQISASEIQISVQTL